MIQHLYVPTIWLYGVHSVYIERGFTYIRRTLNGILRTFDVHSTYNVRRTIYGIPKTIYVVLRTVYINIMIIS